MAKALVWNDNKYPYTEKFKGETITIPPHKFIEMDYEEAILFKGTFNSITREVDGNPSPKSYKMIRIEKVDGESVAPEQVKLRCQACNYEAADQVDLAKHIAATHAHLLAEESKTEATAKLTDLMGKKK